MKIIVGLGNPGEEYELTRHNTGRIVLFKFLKAQKFSEPVENKKIKALKTEGKVRNEKVIVLMPETYMNKSGLSLKNIITSKKKAADMVVVHDDIDLPLGKYKISFGRGSAGHKGVESIIRMVKTKDFTRIRIGISPATPTGKIKKPKGDKLLDFITGKFKQSELEVLEKSAKEIIPELEVIVQGRSSK